MYYTHEVFNMRTCIDENMRDILIQAGRKSVWYGDIDILEMCAKQCNICNTHPQKTIRIILNYLDKSSLFFKTYIRSDVSGRNRRYRCFTLKEMTED